MTSPLEHVKIKNLKFQDAVDLGGDPAPAANENTFESFNINGNLQQLPILTKQILFTKKSTVFLGCNVINLIKKFFYF